MQKQCAVRPDLPETEFEPEVEADMAEQDSGLDGLGEVTLLFQFESLRACETFYNSPGARIHIVGTMSVVHGF